MIQELERRKARDPTASPGESDMEIEHVEQILDPVIVMRLWSVRTRIERGLQSGIRQYRERGLCWDRKNILIPLNRLYPLDYTVDPTQVWMEYMRYGSQEECGEDEGEVVAPLTPACETVEPVNTIGTKDEFRKNRTDIVIPHNRLYPLDDTSDPTQVRVGYMTHGSKEECRDVGGGVAAMITPEGKSIELIAAVSAKVEVSDDGPEVKDEDKV